MPSPIVILVGKGRSGKDTAGAALAKSYNGVAFGLADPIKRFLFNSFEIRPAQLWGDEKEVEFEVRKPWAEDCWRALSLALYGWKTPAELSRLQIEKWLMTIPARTTARHLMQTFGTECVRYRWPGLWIDHGLWLADQLLDGGAKYDRELGLSSEAGAHYDLAIITDGRFRNEIGPVKRRNGVVAKLKRDIVQDGFSAQAKQHRSETESDTIPDWWADVVIYNNGTLAAFQAAAVSVIAQAFMGRSSMAAITNERHSAP